MTVETTTDSPQPSHAVVAVPPAPQTVERKVPVPLVGQLNDLDQAYRYAQALAQSNLLPKDLFGKPANVLTIILYGQQLGLTPMQAIQSIYVVNGRPSMSGQLWLSKVREAGHRVKVTDHTAKSCTVTITRGDSEEQHAETFTWDEAVTAKLTGKDVWKSYPKRMLLWRAVSNCATVICPEVALGFDAENDMEPAPERPTLGQVAAQRGELAAEGPVDAEIVDDDTDAAEVAAALAELDNQHAVDRDTEQGMRDDDPDLLAEDGE